MFTQFTVCALPYSVYFSFHFFSISVLGKDLALIIPVPGHCLSLTFFLFSCYFCKIKSSSNLTIIRRSEQLLNLNIKT